MLVWVEGSEESFMVVVEGWCYGFYVGLNVVGCCVWEF